MFIDHSGFHISPGFDLAAAEDFIRGQTTSTAKPRYNFKDQSSCGIFK